MENKNSIRRGRHFIFAAVLLSVIPALSQIHVAVSAFTNESGSYFLDSWERIAPELLQAELSQMENITILERNKLKAVIEEHKLALSGLADSNSVKRVGQIMGAEFILSGTIHQIKQSYRIDVAITRVKTGEVSMEKAEAYDTEHLSEMIHLLANNIHYRLAGQGSYMEKIAISRYPTTYFLLATAGFGAAAIYFNGSYEDNYREYHDTISPDEFDGYYDNANNARKASLVMASLGATALVGTLYCWIRNKSIRDVTAFSKKAVKINPEIEIKENEEVRIGLQIRF